MIRWVIISLMVVASLFLAACAGAAPESAVVDREVVREVPVVVEKEVMEEVSVEAMREGVAGPQGSPGAPAPSGVDASSVGGLEVAQRQVISQAFVSLEAEDVPTAIAQVRSIAEGLGGFVQEMSRSGELKRQGATVVLRVPQAQFFTALGRIEGLGEVQREDVSSQDVTEQFIDLQARLKSALREEESLLSLLQRAATVSEILTIERELSRVRSEIERLQGQLNFLERRVELATITVSLSSPTPTPTEPPSASLAVAVPDVTGTVGAVKALVSNLDGVVDRVLVSVRDGKERADLSLRVFTSDFDKAMASLEGQGKVRSKDVREGRTPLEGEATPAEEPDARIDLSLVEAGAGILWWIVAIVAPIGGVLLVVLLFLTYRLGRRRRRST